MEARGGLIRIRGQLRIFLRKRKMENMTYLFADGHRFAVLQYDETRSSGLQLSAGDRMLKHIFRSTTQRREEVAPPGDLGLASALHDHVQELRELFHKRGDLRQQGIW